MEVAGGLATLPEASGFMCAIFACFFYPCTAVWQSLEKNTKIVIICIITFVVGTADNVLDWYVGISWIIDGLPIRGAAMIFFIMLAGLVVVSGENWNHNESGFRLWKTPFFLIGLSVFFHSRDILFGSDRIEVSGRRLKYVRILEVMFEAIPGGGLQLFLMFYENEFETVNVISVAFSMISIGYAMEQTFSDDFEGADRIVLGFFIISDFFLRVVPLALVCRHVSALTHGMIFLAIYLIEWIATNFIVAYERGKEDGESDSCIDWIMNPNRYPEYFVNVFGAIPNCVSVIWTLIYREFTPSSLRWGWVIVRFIASISFAVWNYVKEEELNYFVAILIVGVINLGCLCWLLYLQIAKDIGVDPIEKLIEYQLGPLLRSTTKSPTTT